MTLGNLVSFAGIFVLMAIAWALSSNRRKLNLRVVGWGVGLQLALALAVFRAPRSRDAFLWLNDVVLQVLTAAQAGQRFLFGGLAENKQVGFVLALQALPVIIFFAALMGLLYYWGIMQWVIRGFAWLFTRLMRISGAESLCTASNIFVGIESATTIRPYLKDMTRSEFCLILTAGMATVASSTLAVYVGFLKDLFPTIAGHLISASLLSAPAAIVMAKLLVPETGEPLTLGRHAKIAYQRESSAIEAIINGAMAGVKLVVGICALLIAFLGLIALIDLGLGVAGDGWTRLTGQHVSWSLGGLLGYVMWPLAVVMGVSPSDALSAGSMLGTRAVATEIPAYIQLAAAIQSGSIAPRSAVILAYALCGFAHVASLAIFVGGIAALVPERRKDLASVGPRALLAATLACLMTGAVAGTFFQEDQPIIAAPTVNAPASRPATAPATVPARSPDVPDAAPDESPVPAAGPTHPAGGRTSHRAALICCLATFIKDRRDSLTDSSSRNARATWGSPAHALLL